MLQRCLCVCAYVCVCVLFYYYYEVSIFSIVILTNRGVILTYQYYVVLRNIIRVRKCPRKNMFERNIDWRRNIRNKKKKTFYIIINEYFGFNLIYSFNMIYVVHFLNFIWVASE